MEMILQIAEIMRRLNSAEIIATALEDVEFYDDWSAEQMLHEILYSFIYAVESKME